MHAGSDALPGSSETAPRVSRVVEGLVCTHRLITGASRLVCETRWPARVCECGAYTLVWPEHIPHDPGRWLPEGPMEGQPYWDVSLVRVLLAVADQGCVLPADRACLMVDVSDADLLACGNALQTFKANASGLRHGERARTDEEVAALLDMLSPAWAGLAAAITHIATMWHLITLAPMCSRKE